MWTCEKWCDYFCKAQFLRPPLCHQSNLLFYFIIILFRSAASAVQGFGTWRERCSHDPDDLPAFVHRQIIKLSPACPTGGQTRPDSQTKQPVQAWELGIGGWRRRLRSLLRRNWGGKKQPLMQQQEINSLKAVETEKKWFIITMKKW